MKENTASVSFYIEKTKPNTEGKCPIKMVLYYSPNKKRYATNCSVTINEWEKINGSNLKDAELKKIKINLETRRIKAEKVIEKLQPFSFVAFEEMYFGNVPTSKNTSLNFWFNNYIENLKSNGNIGTAISYKTTINSINQFKKNLHLQDITPNFLNEYEKHLTDNGKSTSTVGIYMRQLRAIINKAIDEGLLLQEKYPFKKYEIPSGQNIKKALSNDDLKKLLDYKPKKKDEEKALDFWIFSYLCSGINFADIIELRPSNISGNHLAFIRAKTKNTKKKDLRPIKVGLNPRALQIINKWKNKDADNPYLFPILEPNLPALTIKHRCQRFIKWVNKRMEIIRLDLGIEQKIGTYAARHSFSTTLKRKGVSTEFISESLGHSSVLITANYLDSFTDETKLEFTNLLTDL